MSSGSEASKRDAYLRGVDSVPEQVALSIYPLR